MKMYLIDTKSYEFIIFAKDNEDCSLKFKEAFIRHCLRGESPSDEQLKYIESCLEDIHGIETNGVYIDRQKQ